MPAKIDIHPGNSDVEKALGYVDRWNIPQAVKADLRQFLADLSLGKVNKGRQVAPRTQTKYVTLLRAPMLKIAKPLDQLTKSDLEAFDRAISTDQIITEFGRPFSRNMKKDMRIALRVLLRWKVGKKKADAMTDFFDTREITKTPEYLREAEVEKLYKACKSPEERFLIAVLFDTGARPEEMHNIRLGDVESPSGQVSFFKITLKEEFSKTKGRTVSLYWKYSAEAVHDYLKQRQMEGIKSDDPLYPKSYAALRLFLHRLGKKILGRPAGGQLFRHTSATFYASKMNRQQLCIRYGWGFSSRMPDVYIARAGVDTQELDEKFVATEVNALEQKMAKMEHASRIKEDRIKQLESEMEASRLQVSEILEVLKRQPSIRDVEAAIQRNAAD